MTETPRVVETPRLGTNPRIKAVALAAAPFLTRGVELNELLHALVDAIVKNLDAERGTLYLVDQHAKTLTSLIAHLPELAQIRLAMGQGVAGWVAVNGAPLIVAAPQSDSRFDATFDQKTGFVTRSILAVPVKDTPGDVIGVLQILNARAGSFTADDEKAALELASQAGKIIEHTSLYAELKHRTPVVQDQRPTLSYRFNQIVGESPAMRDVYALVEKAARTSATVLLNGESGTGKELIARAIHVNSPRKSGPFVKVDCTTLPEALIENELFGHEKGAFTGADKSTEGKLEAAHGGTLFIDEIGELPLKVQGKLLRVLQDREFEKVGSTKTQSADIRVICATHRDLFAMAQSGQFREDLYYRVRVVPIVLPPLRARGSEDLVRLVEHFIEKFARRHSRAVERITDAAMARLKSHPFPGNIRELENCIESAVVLCEDAVIDSADLPLPPSLARSNTSAGLLGDPDVTLEQIENEHIRRVVDACQGNQSEAARRLGIGRNTLARKLSPDALPED
jgi:Nif-specific regulatory protein